MLFAFAGLPGTGKTTIARSLAARLRAPHLRIDTVEQALRAGGLADPGPAGYAVSYRVAADQLRLGLDVVADGVNPLRCTRTAWAEVAAELGVRCLFVEVVCSDRNEHRLRIEARQPDIEGHVLPDWDAVLARPFEPMEEQRLLIDTAVMAPEEAVSMILAHSGVSR